MLIKEKKHEALASCPLTGEMLMFDTIIPNIPIFVHSSS